MPTGGHPSDKPGDEPLSEAGNREYALRSLAALGRLPAVSYYEHRGADYVKSACEQAGLVVRVDRWGNVLATRPGADTDAPGLAFVAHLDHPGFEAVSYDGGYLLCRALGGVPPGALRSGTAVQLITDDDPVEPAHSAEYEGPSSPACRSRKMRTTPRRGTGHVLVDAEERVGNLPCAVVFDLPDFDLDGSMIRMRALDDLAGCAAVLALLRASTEFETPGAVHGLFTRAEEVGLVGARLAAADGLLPKDTDRDIRGVQPHTARRRNRARAGDTGGRREDYIRRRRRGIPRNGQRPTCKRRGVQESATAYERRSVRGDGVFRVRIPNDRNGISARQLPQRQSRRLGRRRVDRPGGLRRWSVPAC